MKALLLKQCGIALGEPGLPPALIHAAYGIQLYGHFFTDQDDRQAIRELVERFSNTHAWPVEQLLRAFR